MGVFLVLAADGVIPAGCPLNLLKKRSGKVFDLEFLHFYLNLLIVRFDDNPEPLTESLFSLKMDIF